MKRVALYFRVSTEEQTTEPQKLELRHYCELRGWKDPVEYSDRVSGAKWSRIGFEMLMADVRANKLDIIVCVKLDRMGRSLAHMAQIVFELDARKVGLICTTQGIDTTDQNPAGRLQMHVLMAVAEFERSLIQERTKAGVASARANGSTLGRPRFIPTEAQQAQVEAGARGEVKIAELARALGCSVGKAHGLVKAEKAKRGD